jgi:hypothetical protein
MSSSVSEQHANAPAGENQPPPNKPRAAAPRGDTAPSKARSGRKAMQTQKSAKGPKRTARVRKGSKTAKILALLERSGGATMKQLMKATSWQSHSVRGFLSGVVSKKMGVKVRSTQDESGERRYAVKS